MPLALCTTTLSIQPGPTLSQTLNHQSLTTQQYYSQQYSQLSAIVLSLWVTILLLQPCTSTPLRNNFRVSPAYYPQSCSQCSLHSTLSASSLHGITLMISHLVCLHFFLTHWQWVPLTVHHHQFLVTNKWGAPSFSVLLSSIWEHTAPSIHRSGCAGGLPNPWFLVFCLNIKYC